VLRVLRVRGVLEVLEVLEVLGCSGARVLGGGSEAGRRLAQPAMQTRAVSQSTDCCSNALR
jgi:hypothetical protein